MALVTVAPLVVAVPALAEGAEPFVATLTLVRGAASPGDFTFKCRTTIPKEMRVRPASGVHTGDSPLPVDLVFNSFAGKGKIQVQITDAAGATETHVVKLEAAEAQGEAETTEAAAATPGTSATAEEAAEAPRQSSTAEPHAASPPPASPADSIAAERVNKFDLGIELKEIMATHLSSHRAYAVRWKRGSAVGESEPVKGDGGRVTLNSTGGITGCKVSWKDDGTAARRLLQLTILSCQIGDEDDDSGTLPTVAAMEPWGTVKIDTSEYVSGRREAQLPVKVEGGGHGVLVLAVTMTPVGSSTTTAATEAAPVGGTSDAETRDTRPAGDVAATTPAEDGDDEPLGDDDVVEAVAARRRPAARRQVEAPTMVDFDFAALGKAAGKAGAGAGGGGGELHTAPTAAQQSNVFVCVRVRPLIKRIEQGDMGWKLGNDGRSLVALNEVGASYEYDHVISPKDTNETVYGIVGPRFVDGVVDGINGTVFMYGQTASGKTHTMLGEPNEPGVTQRIVQDVFEKVNARVRDGAANGQQTKASVQVGYFEVYNEELNDLLDPSRKNLPVRASKDGGFQADIVYRPVGDAAKALAVIQEGAENKKMGQSVLNDRSSRSHSIFRLRVRVRTEAAGGKARTTMAELNLVDLAGSETLSEKGDDTNKKETSHINLSLTYLKKVIGELAHKASFISYRNSVLTKILKQALGGNSRTTVICCMTPAVEHFKDSRNTLAFGTTAREVVLTARANTNESGAAMNAAARAEMQKLETQMVAMRSAIEQYQGLEKDYDEVAEDNERLAAACEKLQALLRRARREIKHLKANGAPAAAAAPHDVSAAQRYQDPNAPAAPPAAQNEDGEPQQPQHDLPPEDAFDDVGGDDDVDPNDGYDYSGAYDVPDFPEEEEEDAEADGGDNAGGFDDAVDVGPAAPSKDLLAKAPKNRPPPVDGDGVARSSEAVPRISEAQLLRRELNRLRKEHREEIVRKNEEMQRAVEHAQLQAAATSTSATGRALVDEIPAAKAKDDRVATLLDQIDAFLHYGTGFLHVVEGKSKKWEVHTHRHVYVSKDTDGKGNGRLIVCAQNDGGARDRNTEHVSLAFKDVKRFELGQDHEAFASTFTELGHQVAALEKKEQATTTQNEKGAIQGKLKQLQELISKLRRLERSSFTVIGKKKKLLHVVCQNSADFEAWVVGLNRIVDTSAEWPVKMALGSVGASDAELAELDEEEQDFCATLHIAPREYLKARNTLFGGGPRLITLFDLRAASGLDLYHSQRFFFFARCRGWIDAASVFFLSPSAIEQDFADVGEDPAMAPADDAGFDDAHAVEVVDEEAS